MVNIVTHVLVRAIIEQHPLRGDHSIRGNQSIHFVDHWARVFMLGRRLGPLTGARQDVVDLFAVFHDAGRRSDGTDRGHGARGAEISLAFRGKYFQIDEEGMDLLFLACRDHTRGAIEADITVQTCWDCDRLDLGRAGIKPVPARLCTPAARVSETIEWAHQLSVLRYRPEEVLSEWGMNPNGDSLSSDAGL